MLCQIRALGCSDETKIMMAYQTYIELTEIDHLINVTCNYHASIDLISLSVNEGNFTYMYVPVHTSFSLSPSWIAEVQNVLNEVHKSIVLVIRDGDSSSVSYQLTQGLVSPFAAQNKRLKFQKSSEKIMKATKFCGGSIFPLKFQGFKLEKLKLLIKNSEKTFKPGEVVWRKSPAPEKMTKLKAIDNDGPDNGAPFTFKLAEEANSEIHQKFAVKSDGYLEALTTFRRGTQKVYDVPISITDSEDSPMTGTSYLKVAVATGKHNRTDATIR